MKVVIAGQKWLGAEVLGMCRDLGHHVVQAVVPSPDDRLAVAASAAGVPVTVEARRVDTVTPSDILIAAHCHAFITPRARATAAVAAVGYHPSLLPRHRGRNAVEETVRRGDPIAGGSVYVLNDRMDGGPVVVQRACHVLPGETAPELWRRALGPLGVALLRSTLSLAEKGRIAAEPQDERFATWAPR